MKAAIKYVRWYYIRGLGIVVTLEVHLFLCRVGPFIRCYCKNGGKIGQILGNGNEKRGQKVAPRKILHLFSDLKFYVDFDFAIKHDLELLFHYAMMDQRLGPKSKTP